MKNSILKNNSDAADGNEATLWEKRVSKNRFSSSNITYDIVVLAANGVGLTLALADANDIERGAISSNESVQRTDGYLEEVEQGREGTSGIGLLKQINFGEHEYQGTMLTAWTWLQHWMGPVLQLPALLVGVAVAVTVMVLVGAPPPQGAGAGEATTNTTKKKITERIEV